MKLTVIHRRSLRISGVEIVLFSLTRSVIVVLSTRVSVDPCRSWFGTRSVSFLDGSDWTDSCRLSSNAVERWCSGHVGDFLFGFSFRFLFSSLRRRSGSPAATFGRNGQRFAPPLLMMSVLRLTLSVIGSLNPCNEINSIGKPGLWVRASHYEGNAQIWSRLAYDLSHVHGTFVWYAIYPG